MHGPHLTVDLYARISLDKRGNAESVEDQEAAMRKWCAERGWTVADVYTDNSISAYGRKKRPGFEALLARTQVRPVVVVHMDRLARVSEGLERVIDAGFDVHTLNSGHVDLTTPAGRATARTLVAWATAEVETKAQRQKDRNAADAAKGRPYWRRRPFGYELDGSLRDDEADAIRDGAEAILAGSTVAAVARDWNTRGLTTPVQKSMGGKPWTISMTKAVLTAERIAGLRVYDGQTIKGTWTPILPEDRWRTMLTILRDPARGTGGGRLSHWLSGVARCGTCDDGTTVWSGKGGRKDHRRRAYVCSKRQHNVRTAEPIEDHVRFMLLWLVTDPDRRGPIIEDPDAPDLELLRAEAVTLRNRIAEWEAAAAAGDVGPGEFRRITSGIKEQITDVERRMAHRDRADLFSDLIGFRWEDEADRAKAIATWESLTVQRKQAIVRAVFDEVTLLPGDRRRAFSWASVRLVPHGASVPLAVWEA